MYGKVCSMNSKYKKNRIVRKYMRDYNVKQADLAKAMYISQQEICFALKYELAPEEQQQFIEKIIRIGHKEGDKTNG